MKLSGRWVAAMALLLVLGVVTGILGGLVIYARIGPDAARIEAPIQVVSLAVAAAAIGLLGVMSAAAINSMTATTVATLAREDAVLARDEARADAEIARRDARAMKVFEAALPIYGDLAKAADRHAREVEQQVAWRQEINSIRDAETAPVADPVAPQIGSTESMIEAIASLYAYADQATADAALELYNATVILGSSHAYVPARHLRGGLVVEFEPSELQAHAEMQVRFRFVLTDFLNAVRRELGNEVLRDPPQAL